MKQYIYNVRVSYEVQVIKQDSCVCTSQLGSSMRTDARKELSRRESQIDRNSLTSCFESSLKEVNGGDMRGSALIWMTSCANLVHRFPVPCIVKTGTFYYTFTLFANK